MELKRTGKEEEVEELKACDVNLLSETMIISGVELMAIYE